MNAIEKALVTWYPKKNHPLHMDVRPSAVKLAGEAGEILDLYGKNEYKPNFDWWICKHCREIEEDHSKNNSLCSGWWNNDQEKTKYTPLILDELGDLWYYLRILSYQNNIKLKRKYVSVSENNIYINLSTISYHAATINFDICSGHNTYKGYDIDLEYRLCCIYTRLLDTLQLLNTSLDNLTELNYLKLDSDPTNHGWSDK